MTSEQPEPTTTPSESLAPSEPEAPAPLNDDTVRQLHPNYVSIERLVGWIVFIVFAVGVIVGNVLLFWLAEELRWRLGLVVLGSVAFLGGLAWLTHCWPPIAYRHRSYRVNNHRIEIRKGVLWRTILDVPRSRVQHTDVNQGPMERKYGLAHLIIHTAGTTSANVTLEGLGHETAVRIRDHLVSTGGDDAV